MYEDRPVMSLKVLRRKARCRRLSKPSVPTYRHVKICLCHAFQTTETLSPCQRHSCHHKINVPQFHPHVAAACVVLHLVSPLQKYTTHIPSPRSCPPDTLGARAYFQLAAVRPLLRTSHQSHTRLSTSPSTVPNIGVSKASKRDEHTHPPASLGAF